jgi:hypothetical protein
MQFDFYCDRDPARDVDDLIRRCCRPSGLASPTRSTVPLLSLLKHNLDVADAACARLGLNEAIGLHFEFTVRPPKGIGKASHTDLMVMTAERCIAVEAKWTEPRYKSVRAWLQEGGPNRIEVIDGWRSLLNACAERPVDLDDVMEVRYQLIHRAASACACNRRRPALSYLQFFPQPDGRQSANDHVRKDLYTLRAALGEPDGFPFYVLEVELEPTVGFEAIANLPKGSADTGFAVIDALLAEPLFEFLKWDCDVI